MKQSISIYTLGQIKIEKEEEILVESSTGIPGKWALFLVLYFHAHETLSLDYLVEKLGMDQNETPRQSLRMMIYRLRRDFADMEAGEEVILTENGGYTFNSELEVWLDAARFEELSSEGKEEADQAKLRRVMDLYNGPFMAGLEENLWILKQRRRYRKMYRETVNRLTDLLVEEERYAGAEEVLDEALKYCPLENEIHARLVEVARRAESYQHARQRAEESAAFFQQNGLQVPEEIREHLKPSAADAEGETPLRMRDPLACIRERSAAGGEGPEELGPITFTEVAASLRGFAGENLCLLSFKLEEAEDDGSADAGGNLSGAERILFSSLEENLPGDCLFCRWQQGHFLALTRDDGERDEGEKAESLQEKIMSEMEQRKENSGGYGLRLRFSREEI